MKSRPSAAKAALCIAGLKLWPTGCPISASSLVFPLTITLCPRQVACPFNAPDLTRFGVSERERASISARPSIRAHSKLPSTSGFSYLHINSHLQQPEEVPHRGFVAVRTHPGHHSVHHR